MRLKSLAVVAAASTYAVCRKDKIPLTIEELAFASKSTSSEIGRSYKSIADEMTITPPVPNGTRYVLRLATGMGVSREVADLSVKIEKMALERGLVGRRPMTLAAGAVYTASLFAQEHVTQSDVAQAAGVSELSVRDCSKAIQRLIVRHPRDGRSGRSKALSYRILNGHLERKNVGRRSTHRAQTEP